MKVIDWIRNALRVLLRIEKVVEAVEPLVPESTRSSRPKRPRFLPTDVTERPKNRRRGRR